MLLAFAAIVAYDVAMVVNGVPGDTISELSLGWSYRWSILPVAWGVVVGHLFIPSAAVTYKRARLGALALVGCALFALNVYDALTIVPPLALVLGVLLGRLLWPQRGRHDAS